MSVRVKNLEFIGDSPEVYGINGDRITNNLPGVWDFGGTVLSNCTILGTEQLARLTTTLFVHQDFTENSNFFNTIQAAIDSIIDMVPYTIIVFGGEYDGFSIANKNYITIYGQNNVKITSPYDSSCWINFENATNCSIINVSINGTQIDDNIINLNNSSVDFEKIYVNFNLSEAANFSKNIISGNLSTNRIKISNSEFFVNNTIGSLGVVGEFNFLYLNSNDQNIDINNCIFSYKITDATDSIEGKYNLIKNRVANISQYFMKINNSKFYIFAPDGSVQISPISSDVESAPNILVSNSFSNLSFDDLLKQSNNYEDTYYTI